MDKHAFYMTNFVDGVEFTTELYVLGKLLRYSNMFEVKGSLQKYFKEKIFVGKATHIPELPLDNKLEKIYKSHVEIFVGRLHEDYLAGVISELEYYAIDKIGEEIYKQVNS